MVVDVTDHQHRQDQDDPLMSIGMFSRASLVSVKALRSYHELGLLIPDHIDPQTDYRSYRVSQMPDAVIVKRLRDLDLPLKDVAEIVRARDPEVTRKVISEHVVAMRERLAEVAVIVDELQLALELPSLNTLDSTVKMMFIGVPEAKEVKNRVHLDLHADDRAAEVERLIALGATHVHDKDEWGISWTTLADPEGNEFCVAAH